MIFPTSILENVKIVYKLKKSRTSSARFKHGNILEISLSSLLGDYEKERLMKKFLLWAEKKVKSADKDVLFKKSNFQNGDILKTINKDYVLHIKEGESPGSKAKLIGDNIYISLSPFINNKQKVISELIRKILTSDNQAFLEKTLKRLNESYIQERFIKCRFQKQNTRFGSCSRKKIVNISSRLLFAPKEVFEYVCIHELAHLKHFNHSNKFWDLINEIDPNYQEKEAWLKKNGAFIS